MQLDCDKLQKRALTSCCCCFASVVVNVVVVGGGFGTIWHVNIRYTPRPNLSTSLIVHKPCVIIQVLKQTPWSTKTTASSTPATTASTAERLPTRMIIRLAIEFGHWKMFIIQNQE